MPNTRRSSSGANWITSGDPPRTPPTPKVKALVRSSSRKDDSPRRPSFMNSNSIVTIIINQNGKNTFFSVHTSYLTAYSAYFRAALNGSFTEAQTLKFEFNDISPSVFDIFVSWAYTQKIVDSAGNAPIFHHLVELWLLGDRFQIPRIQNEALVAMNSQAGVLNRVHSMISFHHVYDNTMDESPLRLFLAALSSQSLMKEAKTIQLPEQYPHQMLVDMFNWGATHHKKLAKFTQADLEKFYVSQDESTTSLRSVGSLTSPASPVSPSNSFSSGSTFAGGF